MTKTITVLGAGAPPEVGNATTAPQFLEWLTSKVSASAIGKVIPPVDVIADEAKERVER